MKERLAVFFRRYRWWLAILAIFAVSVAIAYRFWLYPCQPEDAIPQTTALAFRWEKGKNTFSARDSTGLPVLFQAFPDLAADYQAFSTFLPGSEALVSEESLWMVQNLGKGELALAAVLEASALPWAELLSAARAREASFRGHSVYSLSLAGGGTLAAARYRNLVLLGRLPLQVESAIARLRDGGAGAAFSRGGEPGIYLWPDNLLSLGTGIIGAEARQALSRLGHWCSGIKLELSGKGDTLAISGRLELGPEAGRRFSIPASSRGEGVLAYLPGNLAWCYRQPMPAAAPEKASDAFRKYVQPWLGGDMAQLSLGLPGPPSDNQITLLAIGKPEMAARSLDGLAAELGSLEEYDYQSYQVKQILARSLLSPVGVKVQNPYLAVMGGYLAVSSSRVAIEQLISNLIVGNNLGQDVGFLGLYAGQEAGSRAWLYARTGLSAGLLPAYLQSRQESFGALLRSYDACLLTFSPAGAISGLAVRGGAQARQPEPMLAWKAALDAPARGAVQAFPLDETGPGFLIQDEANALYLLGTNGERRRKFQIDGPILGEISLADYFGGPLRDLAFATPAGIRVLSAEGEERGNFHIPLESPAISPLLLADFEGQGQYCFFVACANGYIYGWDRQGKPLPGWNPQAGADSTLHLAMAHFQYAGKDYILALSDAGALFAFQRDGALRFEPVKTGARFLSPPFFQAEGDIGRIALGDSEGFAHIVNLEGAAFRLRLLPQPGPGARFLFGNLTGDDRKDYLAYRGAEMRAHFYEGNSFRPFFTQTLPSVPDTVFLIPRPGYAWIGLLDRKAGKISLLDNAGQPIPGFPLAGDTPFVMTPLRTGGQLVVAGNGASVYAYRLEL